MVLPTVLAMITDRSAGTNANQPDGTIVIDCDRCELSPDACSDCVVGVLLGAPETIAWDDDERRAVDALTDGGVLPRLRLVSRTPYGGSDGDDRTLRAG